MYIWIDGWMDAQIASFFPSCLSLVTIFLDFPDIIFSFFKPPLYLTPQSYHISTGNNLLLTSQLKTKRSVTYRWSFVMHAITTCLDLKRLSSACSFHIKYCINAGYCPCCFNTISSIQFKLCSAVNSRHFDSLVQLYRTRDNIIFNM